MADQSQPTTLIRWFSDIQPVEREYFWYPYLSKDNLNYVFGNGGVGKSTFIANLIAAVTNEEQPEDMPGVLEVIRSNVLYLGIEEKAENYSLDLEKAGANKSKVATMIYDPTERTRPLPTIDKADLIQGMILESKARLLVIDPIQSFLPKGIDPNKMNDLRTPFDVLRVICEKNRCTAVMLGHANKNENATNSAYRASGSTEFINACRSALMVGYHPDDGNIRCIAHVKANGKYGSTIQFTIDDDGFHWRGTNDLTGEKIANTVRSGKANDDLSTDALVLLVKNKLAYSNVWETTITEMIEAAADYPECALFARKTPKAAGRALITARKLLKEAGITLTQTREGTRRIKRFERVSNGKLLDLSDVRG